MDKRKLIFTSLIVLALVVAALSISYALNVAVTEGTSSEYDLSYTFDISDNATWTINVPAGKTKVYDISVTNPYNDIIKYGVVYKLDNPTTMPSNSLVGVLNTTENPSQGNINANSTLEISVAIVNNSSSNMQVTLGIVNGYKNGGDLILPSGYTLVTRNVSLPYDVPSETLMGETYQGEEYQDGGDWKFLSSTITRGSIENIEFIKTSEVPSGVSSSTDVSENQDGSVLMYTKTGSTSNKYIVYIATASGKVSLPEDSSYIFSNLYSISYLDLSNVYTTKVTDMNNLFSFDYLGGDIEHTINLSNFDTSNVTNMDNMFSGAMNLISLDLSSFNTSNVVDMYGMFGYCASLTELDLNTFNTSNVVNMTSMFKECTSLTTIYVSNKFVTTNVTNSTSMFSNASKIVGGNGTTYNSSNINSNYARIDSSSTPGYFTDISAKPLEPNSPDLVDGLIPVVYNSSTSKWVKADSANSGNSWYDYNSKKWANAVLVTSTNRSTYQSAALGTEISDSDILAFYVWIPRYKYKVWNISKQAGAESTYAYNAKTEGIDIIFESDKESTGTISCTYNYNVDSANGGVDLFTTTAEICTGSNGDYYTHPAFTFGSDELRGFWISKFEISSSNPSATYGGSNVTNLTVRSLPNVNSWRYNTVSNFSTVIQNMQISSNIYGLSTSRTNTDSHMLTNFEWGAVAYLTNSKYGRCTDGSCTEVTINNCLSYITGIGANSISDSSSSTTCSTATNKYNGEKGVLASTTGNITGVYDMSGGSWEYVMGNISNVTTGYTFYPSSSSFSSSWYTTDTAKYVTTYAYDTVYNNQKAYNRGRLGDATAETLLSASTSGGWYSDYAFFPDSSFAWFTRSGNYDDGSGAGVFGFNYDRGNGNAGYSSRATLVSLAA